VTEPHIAWIEDDQATGETKAVYDAWKKANPHRSHFPDILKCWSTRPDVLKGIMAFSYPLHFQDGSLPVRTKEMIATYISALNQCPY
jgi:Carboxymuconolactone decarboxylase family